MQDERPRPVNGNHGFSQSGNRITYRGCESNRLLELPVLENLSQTRISRFVYVVFFRTRKPLWRLTELYITILAFKLKRFH